LKSARQHLGIGSLVSQHLLQLFDLPSGLVVDDNGLAAADRLVKFHHSVGNRSRDTLIFPRTTDQVVVFVVEGREYVVAIFVGFNAAPVGCNVSPTELMWYRQRTDTTAIEASIDFMAALLFLVAPDVTRSTIQLVASIRVNTDALHNLRLLPCRFRPRGQKEMRERAPKSMSAMGH
jgi:hypothetical protein